MASRPGHAQPQRGGLWCGVGTYHGSGARELHALRHHGSRSVALFASLLSTLSSLLSPLFSLLYLLSSLLSPLSPLRGLLVVSHGSVSSGDAASESGAAAAGSVRPLAGRVFSFSVRWHQLRRRRVRTRYSHGWICSSNSRKVFLSPLSCLSSLSSLVLSSLPSLDTPWASCHGPQSVRSGDT